MFGFGKKKENIIDDQGQPKVAFNVDALEDRHIDELIGICRGITADDIIVKEEASFLMSWLDSHRDRVNKYPFNILYTRLKEMLSDGILDSEEEAELIEIIKSLTGDNKKDTPVHQKSTSLPLTHPEPEIIIEGKSFVFTGVFTVGTRKKCEEIVCDLGGEMHKTIKKTTDYLVIGDIGSDHWVHSTHGRKIEKAVQYQEKGVDIKIISEHTWIKYI